MCTSRTGSSPTRRSASVRRPLWEAERRCRRFDEHRCSKWRPPPRPPLRADARRSGSFLKIARPARRLAMAGWHDLRLALAAYLKMTTPDKEEFTTTQFPAPSLSPRDRRPTRGRSSSRRRAPPEPAPLRSPHRSPCHHRRRPSRLWLRRLPNDDEARRLAELERQRQEKRNASAGRGCARPRSLPITPLPPEWRASWRAQRHVRPRAGR